MRVDVWSDVACPWCAIGLANLQVAIDQLEASDDVEVVLHSFQLDPAAPTRHDTPLVESLARKYGATVDQVRAQQERIAALGAEHGIDFRFDRTIQGNTFDAHRLLHLGRVRGVQLAVQDLLARAYFTDGRALGEAATLREVGIGAGLEEHEVDALLEGDAFAAEVREDLDAARRIGITGVPFFVVDGRLGVSGAQPPDALAELLRQGADTN